MSQDRVKLLLLDVDGILLNFLDRFYDYIVNLYPHLNATKLPENAHHYPFSDKFTYPKEMDQELFMGFMESDYFTDIKPHVGVKESLHRLHQAGWKFVCISHLFFDWSEELEKKRTQNLEKEFGPIFSHIHCVGIKESKSNYLKSYPKAYWVEDVIKNALMGVDHGHHAFLVEHPWNIKEDPAHASKYIRIERNEEGDHFSPIADFLLQENAQPIEEEELQKIFSKIEKGQHGLPKLVSVTS
jgi:hypothetical protein